MCPSNDKIGKGSQRSVCMSLKGLVALDIDAGNWLCVSLPN